MCKLLIVSLILTSIVSQIAATPYLVDSDDLGTVAFSSGDDAALDYQLFVGQQFDNQDGLAEAVKPDDDEADTLFSPDFSDLDGSYFFDELGSTITPKNSEDLISSAATCDTPTGDQSSDSSDLLNARDLSDVFNLRLPDLDKKPSCRNPGYESPQPPTLKPEWAPPPTLDPVNTARCPRESDGIQPIALCCYNDDFGKREERIAVASGCYTCGFSDSFPRWRKRSDQNSQLLDLEVLANGGKCDDAIQRCCKVYHEDVSDFSRQKHPNPESRKDCEMLIDVLVILVEGRCRVLGRFLQTVCASALIR